MLKNMVMIFLVDETNSVSGKTSSFEGNRKKSRAVRSGKLNRRGRISQHCSCNLAAIIPDECDVALSW